ncbi:MAG: heavy metal transporter [Gemmatimonadota bacterium]
MSTQKLHVRGLSREDEGRVESALRSVSGVLYAAANHVDECAEVEFEDDMVTIAELRERLRELGFESRAAG